MALGIALVPEGRRLFPKLTVEENLLLGAFRDAARPAIRRNLALCYEAFPALRERRRQLAGSMSGGQQQMLAIARAIMSAPRVLLVDEPSVGLSPALVIQTINIIRQLKEQFGLTVLMAEQNFHEASRIADRGYIIVHGEIAFEGKSDVATARERADQELLPRGLIMTTPPLLRDRVPYSAIVDRPPLKLPDGGRIIVWTIVNVEEWSIERAMPRTVLPPPLGQPLLPDLPNWAWHEYGMRVGFWRFVEALENARDQGHARDQRLVCRSYPRVAGAARDAGWEFMGHGFIQGPMHHVEDQRAAIRDTIDRDPRVHRQGARAAGKARGSPRRPTRSTVLAEEGIEYVADWVLDDQPVRIRTASGPIVSVPYTVEMNDIPMMALQHHPSAEWLQRGIDHFDRLYAESESITARDGDQRAPLHHRRAAPHRLPRKALRAHRVAPGRALWTGEQILDWYRTQVAAPR